jgi:hypothetical protein
MTEYWGVGGATTAYEAAGSAQLSVPAQHSGGRRAAHSAVIPSLPVLAVTGMSGPGRLAMPGGARRCPRGQVTGKAVPLMLAFPQSDATRA